MHTIADARMERMYLLERSRCGFATLMPRSVVVFAAALILDSAQAGTLVWSGRFPENGLGTNVDVDPTILHTFDRASAISFIRSRLPVYANGGACVSPSYYYLGETETFNLGPNDRGWRVSWLGKWKNGQANGEEIVCGQPEGVVSGALTLKEVADTFVDRTKRKKSDMSCGNPIYPLEGCKKESVMLVPNFGRSGVALTYSSLSQIPTDNPDAIQPPPVFGRGSVGLGWSLSLHKRMEISRGNKYARLDRADGSTEIFGPPVSDGGGWYIKDDENSSNSFYFVANSSAHYIDRSAGAYETYSPSGEILAQYWANGGSLRYFYSNSGTPATDAPGADFLIQVSDEFNRSLSLKYYPDGRLRTITDPTGGEVALYYTSRGILERIVWPGPNAAVKKFLYENTSFPTALTGILDENNVRYATFSYDTNGVVSSTEHAGGVNRYSVAYGVPPKVQATRGYNSTQETVVYDYQWIAPQLPVVTLPNGGKITTTTTSVAGATRISQLANPAGAGHGVAFRQVAYDANGNKAWEENFTQWRTCYQHALSTNTEEVRVEGLAAGTACTGLLVANATLPAGARKTSQQWHPLWRLVSKRAEPKLITTYVYNGEADPTNGGAITNCSTERLPNNAYIAVVCKRVEQATTDASGAQGFTASLDPTVPARVWTWTYNQYGQVLTEDGPRTDVADVTTYVYYPTSGADYTRGDLQQVTDALGRVTTFQKYNRHGQVLQMTDPNGVVTVNTYDLRQRLTSTNVGGQTTTYTYDPVGQLIRVTQPDQSYVSYTYDAAHRLTAITDSKGNKVEYTLDNAGNRTAENVTDPAGVLARTLIRNFDALGRVQQTTGQGWGRP